MSTVRDPINPPPGLRADEPVWEIAHLFPTQGHWSEHEYLALETNHLVEFADGYIEVLPMPTLDHQFIALMLYRLLHEFVKQAGLGVVVAAPYRLRLREGKYREPDVMFVRAEHRSQMSPQFTDAADVVFEVVSEGESCRRRDLIDKRGEYALAGIPEYWIVDPAEGRITVLSLEGDVYVVAGTFAGGEQATSPQLAGFRVDVTELLTASE